MNYINQNPKASDKQKQPPGAIVTSHKAIETIYNVLLPKFGVTESASTVSDILAVVIYRLSDEGKEVNEENISEKLSEIANDYLEASKSDVA